MIALWIDWCARNRFLVFTGTLGLVLAGIWAISRIPLDALPDISDVQVIVHTPWNGQPPNIIEDQVTYPIVTSLLAAPNVKGVRAQTMFGDSYVFVVFEDGTDLYWARSRVLEYMQQIEGRLPAGVHPTIGPDATGAGWVYEYAIVDHNHRYSLADLRSLQDWFLRYQLESVPGVAEVATLGGFVRQYQVRLDPNKLRAYNIPLSMVIDRVRDSTNEVGGRLIELGGAEYMIRGMGYFKSLSDLETVPVGNSNGTPVLVRDLGSVVFGPDIRQGVAEWNGIGETVAGVVVMRYGLNALNVISGVKKKLRDISGSLPPGVEIVTGYDRSGLIRDSISTLQRDLVEEAIIVSLVIIVFLFHFRSAFIPILTLPIAVIGAFLPMYFLQVSSNIMSLGGIALAIGVLVDAAIVMVENGYRHLSEAQQAEGGDDHDIARTDPHSPECRQAGGARHIFLTDHHRCIFPAGISAGSAGRQDVPAVGVDQDSGSWLLLHPRDHAGACVDDALHQGKAAAGIEQPDLARHAGDLPASAETLSPVSEDYSAVEYHFSPGYSSPRHETGQPVYATSFRRIVALHAYGSAGNFNRSGLAAHAGTRQDHPDISGSRERVRVDRAIGQRDR